MVELEGPIGTDEVAEEGIGELSRSRAPKPTLEPIWAMVDLIEVEGERATYV
jgi:hypothetical protein